MKHATSIARVANRAIPATLLVLAIAIPGRSVFGQDVERSFAVAEGDRVALIVEHANVTVTSWDRTEVDFSAASVTGLEFEFSQNDGVVTISGGDVERRGLFLWRSRGPVAEITMNVPYWQHLNLITSGGDIQIDRLHGDFTAHTSGGEIQVGEIDGSVDLATSGGRIRLQQSSGPVTAATSGGSIQFESVAGAVEARTSGGRIRIGEAGATVSAATSGGSIEVGRAAGAVQAQTSGGSVEVSLAGQTDADSELRTSGGSVTVYLPDGFQADLSAKSFGGGVTSDFPELVVDNSAGGGELEQSLNGGGPDLLLRTSGGSIRIRRLEEQPEAQRSVGF